MRSMPTDPPHQYYVSLDGRDTWSGALADPLPDGSDGPFATLDRARDAVRALKRSGHLESNVVVWVRAGRHTRDAPLVFGPGDSAPVRYSSYPGEEAIIDGGRRITGWRTEQRGDLEYWMTDIPEVARGDWYFHQLFVSGQRRPRPRLPREGYYRIKETVPPLDFDRWVFSEESLFAGTSTFRCDAADVSNWANLGDIEVVALHWWIEERLPIARLDAATGTVVSSRRSMFALRDDTEPQYARYYFDNVYEALSEPGQWYLDRSSGKLYYLPLEGEEPETTDVFAPRVDQLLVLQGAPEDNSYVEFLRFEGLGFEHADWHQPRGWHNLFSSEGSEFPRRSPGVDYAAAQQAACNVPGALAMEGARSCAIVGCRISHIGGYGVEVGEGCNGARVVGNVITDLGAGGVKVFGSDASGSRARRTVATQITDNHIHAGGRVHPSGAGVLIAHAGDTVVSHNRIHDLFYSGISCGWVWGYTENTSYNNHLEHNHIYDIGHGLLSDMGGIYTLGAQPGTVVRGNLIHDVRQKNYGGWAIYLDEGSSHIVVESNVCYDTGSEVFHVHYGRENIVRNNIFAFGQRGLVALGRQEDHNSFTLLHNVLVSDGEPVYVGGRRCTLEGQPFMSDLNVLWDVRGSTEATGGSAGERVERSGPPALFGLAEARALGYDQHSLAVDPGCRDLSKRDFTVMLESEAFGLGFMPVDISRVGPRRHPGPSTAVPREGVQPR